MAHRRSPGTVGRRGRPRARMLEELVRIPQRSPLAPELERALSAASRMHMLRSDLEPVPVRPTATTSEAGAYRFVRRDPVDLRVSRRGSWIVLGFLHELGHFVDHQLHYDAKTRAWASDVHPELACWRSSVRSLAGDPRRGSTRERRYFDSPRELWARTYAQTVLVRSGDAGLERLLATLQDEGDPYVWSPARFEPVAREVEHVFVRLGLSAAARRLAA